MLIRFSVANFRSFNEEVVFSMIPGRSRQHENHILKTDSPDGIDVLRMGLLYGANASGKSNLVKAINWAKSFITERVPDRMLPLPSFRLSKSQRKAPSKFQFEFVTENGEYEYGFEINGNTIIAEWLFAIGKNNNNERNLFDRTTENEVTQIQFDSSLYSDTEELRFLRFVARGTPANELFLSSSIRNNVALFDHIYDWFANRLVIIFPDTDFESIETLLHDNITLENQLSTFLSSMNTGIARATLQKLDHNRAEGIFDFMKDNLAPKASIGTRIIGYGDRKLLLVEGDGGQSSAYHLATQHIGDDGSLVAFDMIDESDGTRRLIELFPILSSMDRKVFVIDELERSLHPNLVRQFLQNLTSGSNKNQLIVTSHESTLLDLELLRRDEIWFVEKSPSGASVLYSLEEYKTRPDLDIRKGYLQGRFGAIPVFGSALQLNGEAE